jgi:threonine-phosphate decarboxylase
LLLPSHGSNPHYLYHSLNIAQPDDFIDFSANINPLGPPPALQEKWPQFFELIRDYPDPHAVELVTLIAARERLPQDRIVIGNGGAELITLAARFLAGKKVLIIQPAFSEYQQACEAAGCEVVYHILQERNWELELEPLLSLIEAVDAVFICTPNNPTGVAFREQSVLALLAECNRQGCFTIIDEAFHDFLDQDFTYASYLKEYPNLLILRSLTKMYAIPGLRLGYMLADPDVIRQINSYRPHWSVNNLALMAGVLSLKDGKHVENTKQLIREQRDQLTSFFESNNFIVSDSRVNFYLVKDRASSDPLPLLKFLLEHGIVPRHTFNFPGLDGKWFRFAVKNKDNNDRLVEVFTQWRNHP